MTIQTSIRFILTDKNGNTSEAEQSIRMTAIPRVGDHYSKYSKEYLITKVVWYIEAGYMSDDSYSSVYVYANE